LTDVENLSQNRAVRHEARPPIGGGPPYEKAAAGGEQRRLTNDPPEGLDQRDP
jgi:hypothetical protein